MPILQGLPLEARLIEILRLIATEQCNARSRDPLARGKQGHLVRRQLRIIGDGLRRISALSGLQVGDAHALINVLEAVHPAPDSHTLNLSGHRLLNLNRSGNTLQVGGQVIHDVARVAIGDAPRPRVQVVAQLLDASLECLGEFLWCAVRVFLGDRVDEGAEAGCRVRWAVRSDGGEEPAQRARQRALELRGRQRELTRVLCVSRGRTACPQPAVRLRRKHTFARHESQQGSGQLRVSRLIGVGGARTQVRDVTGQGQRRLHRIHRHDVVLARRARQARHQIEKHRGGRVLRAHRSGVHDAARARHGRDEQAILVVQNRAPSSPRRVDKLLAPILTHGNATRAHVRQQVGAQDPVAQAQVRPGPVLQAREDDDLPVAAHRLRGSEDLDATGAHAHARDGVDRDRAGQQLGREAYGRAGGVALLPHVGDAQKRHDGVQLVVVPARRFIRRDSP